MTAITLTSSELALLAGEGDNVARAACSLLVLDEGTLPIALATLHSRGLLDIASGEPELVGPALVAAAVLQQSSSVITVTTVTADDGGGVHLVRSEAGDLLITPRALGCYDLDLLALPLAQVCREMVDALLSRSGDVLVAVERATGDEREGVAVRSPADGGSLSMAVSGTSPDGPREADRSELDVVLERLLAPVAA